MRTRTRLVYSTLVCVLTGISLSGCSGYGPTSGPSDSPTDGANLAAKLGAPYTFYAKMPNGAEVLCTGVNGYHTGAPPSIDCDYTNAQGLNKLPPGQR